MSNRYSIVRLKGFAPIIIVFILILLGGLGYVVYFKGYLSLDISQETVVSPTPYLIENPEEWKTYRNDELGFEFKYPISWQIISSSSTSLAISNKDSGPALNGTTPLPNQVILNFGLNHASLENYSSIERRYEPIEGVEVIEQGRYIDENNTFGIVSLYRADDNMKSEHEKVINQIISSLKFTDIPE